VRCEYDGQELPTSHDGLPDACPACEADIQDHLRECSTCRVAPNLPETIDLARLKEAFA